MDENKFYIKINICIKKYHYNFKVMHRRKN
jgi:hypothetical protein